MVNIIIRSSYYHPSGTSRFPRTCTTPNVSLTGTGPSFPTLFHKILLIGPDRCRRRRRSGGPLKIPDPHARYAHMLATATTAAAKYFSLFSLDPNAGGWCIALGVGRVFAVRLFVRHVIRRPKNIFYFIKFRVLYPRSGSTVHRIRRWSWKKFFFF